MKSRRPQSFGRPRIHFPEDEGAHPDFLIEWWYGNFMLSDSGGREYGAMAAYFNFGIKIISISDLAAQSFHHEVFGSTPHYARGMLDLRWGGGDHWFRTGPDSPSYRLKAHGTELGLSLDFSSQKPPLLAGGNGIVRWSGGVSYYYSLTRLRAQGQIRLCGDTIDVEGIGWMDHQWMKNLGRRGWDWFSIQLENETEVIVWQIVNPNETIESRDLMIMFPDNSVYHSRRLRVEQLDTWLSPESGREYGVVWRVRDKNYDLDLEIRARQTGQEIRMFEARPGNAFDFWEGMTSVSGRLGGESVSGTGHAEIVRHPRGPK